MLTVLLWSGDKPLSPSRDFNPYEPRTLNRYVPVYDPALWLLAPLVVIAVLKGRKKWRKHGYWPLWLLVVGVGTSIMLTGCEPQPMPTPTPPPPSPPPPPTSPPPSSTPTPLPETCTPTLPPQGRTVYLTFDDGPGWNSDEATNTSAVLDTLHSKGVKATFFVLGYGVDMFPATFVRMVSEGHTIGSHSYNHPWFTTLEDDDIRKQLIDTKEAVENAWGGPLPGGFRYFRPPYGDHDDRTDRIVEEMGYQLVLWDVDSLDYDYQWKGKSADNLADSVVAEIDQSLVQNPIVLFHSTKWITAQALPAVLEELVEGGYQFAPMP